MSAVLPVLISAFGGETDCSFRQCVWRADNFRFGDAWSLLQQGHSEDMKEGQPYNYLKDSLCKVESWEMHDHCLEHCPFALVVSSPSEISMRACLQDAAFVPYAPMQHVDSFHPLNGRDLELIAMGTPFSKTREGCSLPLDGKNYSGKIVLVQRGGCRFDEKGAVA
eukprot:Hpha_TRINITY_DN22638_c0_g1::TRINITY_DN22638_c0_g1_i1::g.192802::m.192802